MVKLSDITSYLGRVISQPAHELDRAQRTMRYMFELFRHVRRELGEDRASQMAAALTYRTIFSLIPLVVMSMLIFRAFGDYDMMQRTVLDQVYALLQVDTLTITSETPLGEEERGVDEGVGEGSDRDGSFGAGVRGEATTGVASTGTATTGVTGTGAAGEGDADADDATEDESADDGTVTVDASEAVRIRIEESLEPLFRKAWELNFGSISAVGMVLLVWAGLGLMVNLEQSFNRVYKAPSGRPWHMRVMIYWAVVTLGPLLLFVSLFLAEQVLGYGRDVAVIGPVLTWLSRFTAMGATWLLLLLMYRLMPNTSVKLQSAATGALVAALAWELSKWLLRLYVENASFGSIYGSLGLIPLFLLWLYVTWMIVLFGLELSYALQAMGGRKFDAEEQSGQQARRLYDTHWIIPIMARVGEAFEKGETLTSQELASELSIPSRAVVRLADQLAEAGLVNHVRQRGGEDALALARPPQRIGMGELLELCRQIAVGDERRARGPGWAFLDRLTEAQREATKEKTLASLLAEGEAIAPVFGEAEPGR